MHYYSELIKSVVDAVGSETVSKGPKVSIVDKKTEFLRNGKTVLMSIFLKAHFTNLEQSLKNVVVVLMSSFY